MKQSILGFILGVLVISMQAQSAYVKEREYLEQLEHFHAGVLMILVSDTSMSSGLRSIGESNDLKEVQRKESERELMRAFEEHFEFSEVLYCTSVEDGLNKLNLNISDPTFDEERLFVGKIQMKSDNHPGCIIVKDKRINEQSASNKGRESYFDLMRDAYDPGSFSDGGIVIRRLSEKRKRLNKKKELLVDYRYNVKLHQSLRLKERFSEAVKYLEEKLQSELMEYREKAKTRLN